MPKDSVIKTGKEAKWVEMQIVGLTSWINSFLTRRDASSEIKDLEKDLCDGVRLGDFLEIATRQQIPGIDYLPKGKIQSLQNLSICLDFMDKQGIRLVGINPGAIYDGNIKLILGLLYSACRSSAITKLALHRSSSYSGKESFEAMLLNWVQKSIAPYNLTAKDFKKSFRDGKVFSALVHSIDPSALHYDLVKSDPSFNLNYAFDSAYAALKIPKLLSVDDLVQGTYDERSIVFYTTLLYYAACEIENKRKEEENKRSLKSAMDEHERVKEELASLRVVMNGLKKQKETEFRETDQLIDENARLKRFVEYWQGRAKLEDSNMHLLESTAQLLHLLTSGEDKQLLQSEATGLFLDVKGNDLAPSKAVSPDAAWLFVPTYDKSKQGGGCVHIFHIQSALFLIVQQGKVGLSSSSSLLLEMAPESMWKVGDCKNGIVTIHNENSSEFLKIRPNNSVELSKTSDLETQFRVSSWSHFERNRRLHKESALLIPSLVQGDGGTMFRHAASQKFVGKSNNSPSMESVVSSKTKWDILPNQNGSARLRSKDDKQYLTLSEKGLALSPKEDDGSSWLFSRSPNHKDLYVLNAKTFECFQCSDDGKSIQISKECSPSKCSWSPVSGQDKLASLIANSLASHGGVASFQNNWTQMYVNHDPSLTAQMGLDTEWIFAENKDGTLSLKSKHSGQFLKHSGGRLAMGGEDHAAHWGVSLCSNGGLVFYNSASGEYLTVGDGSKLQTSGTFHEKDSWVIRSLDGAFSTGGGCFQGSANAISVDEALKVFGSSTLMQHCATQFYINDQLQLIQDIHKDAEWEISASSKFTLSLKSRKERKYLSASEHGSVKLVPTADSSASQWQIFRTCNGHLFIQNKSTGTYLEYQKGAKLSLASAVDEKTGGWSLFSTDAVFNFGQATAGRRTDFGFTQYELDERRKDLKGEIEEATLEVKNQKKGTQRDLDDARMFVDSAALKAAEATKTLAEIVKRVNALQHILDAEKGQVSKELNIRADALNELKEKSAILKAAGQTKEQVLQHTASLHADVEKVVNERKRLEAEIRRLQKLIDELKKKTVVSTQTLSGLRALKNDLEQHYGHLTAWTAMTDEEAEKLLNIEELAKELAGKSFSDQVSHLDGRIQEESSSLLRILKLADGEDCLEEKFFRDGWLQVKIRDEWVRRWCVLSGHSFSYYSSVDISKTPDGVVEFKVGYDIVRQKVTKVGDTKIFPLKILIHFVENGETVVRKLFLRAPNKGEKQGWFAAISRLINRVNYLDEAEKLNQRPDSRIVSFIEAGEGTPVPELYLDHIPISTAGVHALRKGILSRIEILTLSLQQARMGDEGILQLSTVLSKVKNLRYLRVNGNCLTSASVTELLKALGTQNTSLRELDLSHNNIDGNAFDHLGELLKLNPQLTVLNLTNNVLGDMGAASVVKALGHKLEGGYPKIDTLALGANKIGEAGAQAVAQLLADSKTIHTVSLCGNDIGDQGASHIAAAVMRNQGINSVDFSGNPIGPKGALAFKSCLETNSNLETLNLSSIPSLEAAPELSELVNIQGFTINSLVFRRDTSSSA